ncbi:hypothetical protein FOL47_002013 [Perkinsus chesapeaki]|uniref:subtilisin n=1 Tax=Perkinsus chesapeaki TaxID=330153 RepID=A0A7J6KRQ0_PERCH|nr:hypothetical protein FOL47_002013 [Perkinsus chesapeaki]
MSLSLLPTQASLLSNLTSSRGPPRTVLVGKLLGGHDASGSLSPSVEDIHGHVTGMSSTIAARINNCIGIAGIVKIRPIRLVGTPTGNATERQVKKAWEMANKFNDSDVLVYAAGEPFTKDMSMMYKRVITEAAGEVEIPCSSANSMPGVVCVAATLTANPMVLLSEASLLASFGVPGTEVMVAEMRNEVGQWQYGKGQGSSCATAILVV